MVTDTDYDYGSIIITFPNVSMTYPILVYLIMGLYSLSYGVNIKVFMAITGKGYEYLAIEHILESIYICTTPVR